MDETKWLKKREKALKENNKELLYESCKKLAEIYKEDGKYEASLIYFKRAQDVCERTVDIAVLNRWIGEVYCDMEMFDEAIDYQKKHLDLSKQEANNIEIQRALATLGRTYFIKALSHTNNRERQKSLQNSYDYYLKSEETCDILIGVSSQDLAVMKARLYLNIGLTLESMDSTEISMSYLNKAVNISKSHDLYAELTQSYTRLAEVYLKQQKHSESLSTIQKCILVSNNQVNSNLFCELLLLKCDTHVDMFDFASAKMDLIQAYKLKHLSQINKGDVEKKLKLIIVLLRNENELLELNIHQEDETDIEHHQSKKKIYEHMGDACAAFGNYSKAVHFYHKMLDSCETVIKLNYGTQLGIGLSDSLDKCCTELSSVVSPELCKDLASCYVSLAQSYKDNKQYSLAVDYFNRELGLHSRNPSEACKTLRELCDLYELREDSFELIHSSYEKALGLAKGNGDLKLQRDVLKEMKNLCKNRDRLAEFEKIKTDLKSVEEKLVDISSSESEDDVALNIGDDINLEELSDLNSEDEKDDRRSCRKRTNKSHFLIKRNDKGETPLHVAAARGNLILVQSLLKQGHPVKVEDSAGWLPLHEAANHGHVDIVEALLQAGADPNDKGGTGISPLHDAATNGFLPVIECLLEKGASTSQRTNQGETALQLLEKCKTRVEETQGSLEPNVEAHFEQVVRKLRVPDALIGEEISTSTQVSQRISELVSNERRKRLESTSRASLRNQREPSPGSCRARSSSPSQSRSNLRNQRDLSPGSSHSPCKLDFDQSSGEESATKTYQKAISNLRYQNKNRGVGRFPSQGRVKQRQRQFLEETEVGDDWLEEDMMSSKKRKYNEDPMSRQNDGEHKRIRSGREVESCKDSGNTGIKRKSNSPVKSVQGCRSGREVQSCKDSKNTGIKRKSNSPVKSVQGSRRHSISPILTMPPGKTPSATCWKVVARRNSRSPEQRMVSLVSFPCERIEPPHRSSTPTKNPFEPSQNLFPEDLADENCFLSSTHDHIVAGERRVTTDSRIPNMASIKVKIETHVFLIPIVEDQSVRKISWLKQEASDRYYRLEGVRPVLRVKTQDGALVDDQDPLASILNESVVHTEVIAWNKPPIIERYRQLCSEGNISVHKHFENALTSDNSSDFILCPCAKSKPTLHTLFKTFLHWSDLTELHLARSFLQDTDLKILAENMSGLTKLQTLNLSCNHISALGVQHISENCAKLIQLREINLSFNPLTSASLPHVNNLLAVCPRLSMLNLSSTRLTTIESNLNLYNITHLNVSHNRLGAQQVHKLLSLLNAETVVSLNFSSTLETSCKPNMRTVPSPCKSPNLYLPDIISMVPRDSGKENQVGITREVVLFLEQSECSELTCLELSAIDMRNEEGNLLHQVIKARSKSLVKIDVSCNQSLGERWTNLLQSVVQEVNG